MKLNLIILTIILIVVNTGCSSVVFNPVQTQNNPDLPTGQTEIESMRHLWGVWDVLINPVSGEIIVTPLRNAEAHFDITPFLIPPKCPDCLVMNMNSFDPGTRIMDLEVTLKNPFAISGYDVRGTIYTNEIGHQLRNADDWSSLFDLPGGLDWNPFKAYAKTNPQRIFGGFQSHSENYQVYIPDPPQWIAMKYSVTASYPGNCEDPYEIENFTQETLTSEIGSNAIISVEVHDSQGDVDLVTIDASEITGDPVTEMVHLGSDLYSIEITNTAGAGAGDYSVLITATSTGSGTLTLYDYFTLTVSEPADGWARTWGSAAMDSGWDNAVDQSGNAYVTGYFQGTADFDPGLGVEEYTSTGEGDLFLTKFSNDGALVWASVWGGTQWEEGYGITTDNSGNVYVTGYFKDTVDFDPGPGDDSRTSAGENDVFLSKFDTDGNHIWVRTWGGPEDDCGQSVLHDSGYIYVGGAFEDIVDFNPDEVIVDQIISEGMQDAFLSKYDTDGVYQWTLAWGGNQDETVYGLCSDTLGYIYTTGTWDDIVDFDPGPGTDSRIQQGIDDDAFISKFSSLGEYQWAITWGGGNRTVADTCATDAVDGLWVCGRYEDTVDFDPGPGEDQHTSLDYWDMFISKFNTSGEYQFVMVFGNDEPEAVHDIAVDSDNNLWMTGRFSDTIDFDPGAETEERTSAGLGDIVLAKYDSSGEFIWVRSWGSWGPDSAWSIALDSDNNGFVSGQFQNTVDFDPGTGVDEHESVGSYDIFLSKFPRDGYW